MPTVFLLYFLYHTWIFFIIAHKLFIYLLLIKICSQHKVCGRKNTTTQEANIIEKTFLCFKAKLDLFMSPIFPEANWCSQKHFQYQIMGLLCLLVSWKNWWLNINSFPYIFHPYQNDWSTCFKDKINLFSLNF